MSTRAHREAGAVGDDADGAVEPDVLEPLALRRPLPLVAHLRRVVLALVGVPERRVVVERHLGVERVHAAVGREDQRVDLDEVGSRPRCSSGRASGGCRPRRRSPPGSSFAGIDPVAALRFGQPVDRVDVDRAIASGAVTGDLLDLDAALRRQHPEVLLRGPVERERRVVLLGDVARLLDPDDVDDVALDVHAEDVARVACAPRASSAASLMPPALPRPPTCTWALTTTG